TGSVPGVTFGGHTVPGIGLRNGIVVEAAWNGGVLKKIGFGQVFALMTRCEGEALVGSQRAGSRRDVGVGCAASSIFGGGIEPSAVQSPAQLLCQAGGRAIGGIERLGDDFSGEAKDSEG